MEAAVRAYKHGVESAGETAAAGAGGGADAGGANAFLRSGMSLMSVQPTTRRTRFAFHARQSPRRSFRPRARPVRPRTDSRDPSVHRYFS